MLWAGLVWAGLGWAGLPCFLMFQLLGEPFRARHLGMGIVWKLARRTLPF